MQPIIKSYDFSLWIPNSNIVEPWGKHRNVLNCLTQKLPCRSAPNFTYYCNTYWYWVWRKETRYAICSHNGWIFSCSSQISPYRNHFVLHENLLITITTDTCRNNTLGALIPLWPHTGKSILDWQMCYACFWSGNHTGDKMSSHSGNLNGHKTSDSCFSTWSMNNPGSVDFNGKSLSPHKRASWRRML